MRKFSGRLIAFFALLAVIGIVCVLCPVKTSAAINPQINFQGKLTNPDGTNVTNGNYSIVFSLYTVSSGGSAVWTETQPTVAVSSGIFQVSLGSVTSLPGSVDFNTSGIYLGVKVGADAEMTPRIQFTAAPYAFNADEIDGLDSTNIVQLANGIQADSSTTNASISINKTGTTANILNLQRGGSDVLTVANDGSTTVKSQTNSANAFQVQDSSGVAIFMVNTIGNAVNLISNPGFEANTTGWSVSGTGTTGVRQTTLSNTYYGVASYQIGTATSGTTTITSNGFTTALSTATQYTFSFYAKASTTVSGLAITIGGDVCTPNATTIGTGAFQRFYCTVTTTSAPSAITTTVTTTGATVYIDGTQLVLGANPLPYGFGTVQIRGIINNPVTIMPSSDSPTVFQVANAAGSSLITVDSEGISNPIAIRIGSPTTDTTQVLLQLDSFNTFADTASCSTTANQGGLYYNTLSNAIRACLNGGWEDLVSTAGLGLQLFGVVPDSGTNPGDMAAVTGVQNGPCKVSAGANLQTVSWKACVAYSGGRKVIVAAGTAGTTNTVANNFQHLCLTAANGQPALSTTGGETANLASVSLPAVSAPILCLADIKFNGTNNTITQIYDTRTYTTTTKTYTALNSAAGVGNLASYVATKGTMVVSPVGPNGNNIAGVVVATTGAASSTTINAIVAIGGPAAVKSVTGINTVSTYIGSSGTAAYATTVTTSTVATTPYNLLGNARTAWSGATACTINADTCAGSVLTDIDKR